MSNFTFDLHTHTIASGHASTATITDLAKAARKVGLQAIGISDHGPATVGGATESYFRNLAYAPKKVLGITILHGAEVNILDQQGSLDLADTILEKLDFVIASMHRPVKKPGTLAENTQAYINAMKNPHVNIIGHPDDAHYPVDYLALVKAAVEHNVLLEVNNGSLEANGYRGDAKTNDLLILNLCKHFYHPVILSSDSHGTEHVGDFTEALELVELADMPRELVLNHSLERLYTFLSLRK